MVTAETIRALAACREQLRAFSADPESRRSVRAAAAAYQESQRSINATLRAAQERHRSMNATTRIAAAASQEQLRSISAAAAEWQRLQRMTFQRIATVVESCKAAMKHVSQVHSHDSRSTRPRWLLELPRPSLFRSRRSDVAPPASAPYRRTPSIGFR